MRSLYKFVSGIILTIAATACFFGVWWNFISENNITGRLTEFENLALAIGIYVVVFLVLADRQCAFKIGVKRFASISAGLILVIFITDLCEIPISMAICGHFAKYAFRFILQYFLLAIIQTFLLCFLTYVLVVLYFKIFPPYSILEITGDHKNNLTIKVNTQTNGYRIKESVNYAIGETELIEKIGKVDGVLIGDVPAKAKNTILKTCLKLGKSMYYVPKISDVIVRESEELNWLDTPLFMNQNTGMGKWREIVKRVSDVLLSALALILLSPLMLMVALAIKLEDGGPVIFKQERCTLHNKRFMILKFRSMIVEAEKEEKPHPTEDHDPRITKVGRVIRAMRIDELPQLINIVKGDMSIVGPRPERVEHVEKYTKEIPEFVLRGMVRGGLTGYAQVYGKYNTQPLDKLKLDLLYIMNFSLMLDLEIMVETVYTLFRKDSTEGFSKELIEYIQK
ncbi:MAG: exopolysaccharide biosynthesis polyprenyl glycosylphosphotransferase [Lachnospiraceae bacterium]|nr:exopolysaccharide biosynthesis polyprenyl glycosylphosphotransferase [Lachnospiraceae bacterium]